MAGKVDFILGGIRSGKSAFAETLARGEAFGEKACGEASIDRKPHYIATAEICDTALRLRIQQHRQRRAEHWINHEVPLDIVACLERLNQPNNVVLLDCLNVWLNNLYYHGKDIQAERTKWIDVLGEFRGYAVIVSAEVGLSLVPTQADVARFCDDLGQLNQDVAATATRVVYVMAGLPHTLKDSTRKQIGTL